MHNEDLGWDVLRTRLNDTLKVAMKAKSEREVQTIRLILAALKDRDIAARGDGGNGEISDDAILSLLQSMVKQRRESIEMYEKGGRLELAQQESEEIAIIETFLPKQMEESEVEEAIVEVLGETGAETIKDMGKVMAALREKYAGRMDFGKVSGKIKAKLTS